MRTTNTARSAMLPYLDISPRPPSLAEHVASRAWPRLDRLISQKARMNSEGLVARNVWIVGIRHAFPSGGSSSGKVTGGQRGGTDRGSIKGGRAI